MPLILKRNLKLLGRFIFATVNPLCVRARTVTVQQVKFKVPVESQQLSRDHKVVTYGI